MNPSVLFVQRPVATSLLTMAILLAGWLGFRLLPVAPLPQVDFPTISVSAGLPGASPETMAAIVATPLERTLGRIAGLSEITSQSTLGSTRIILQFDLSRNIDGAARDVQAAINAARALLPPNLPSNPSFRKVNPADMPIMVLSLTSESKSQGEMYDVAATVLAQKLAQVQGVGQVSLGGSSLPAVRVELDPGKLHAAGIGFEEVRSAIAATNANRPKGVVEQGERQWSLDANDQARVAADYRPIIITWRKQAPVRLADVAEVVDSVQDMRNAGMADGKPAVLLIISRQPGANIIETVGRIRDLVPSLHSILPSSIELTVLMDRTPTIRASLAEVEQGLLLAIVLVILVVFLFLRNVRAALIPTVAVPVSLMGTFGFMYLFGYSLDNLSLMALTIATGFVVDDAIVVLENVSRYLEKGMSPMQATLQGVREVGFTVLSMSVSLVAVFIPILAMGGIVGRLFREFAVTLSIAVLVSLLVSLTTTPAMCARLLRAKGAHSGAGADNRSEYGAIFGAVLAFYARTLAIVLRHPFLTLLVLLATIALNVYLYITIPKGFFPQQDIARLIGTIQGDQGISFQAMRNKVEEYSRIIGQDPAVAHVVAFTGGGQRNSGVMFAGLKPRQERGNIEQVMGRLRGQLARVAGSTMMLQPAQEIRVGGRQGSGTYQYTLQSSDLEELRFWEPKIRQALSELPQLADVSSDQNERGISTYIQLDRANASRKGVTPRLMDLTLNDAYGQRLVSTIYTPLNQYRVVMEAAPSFVQDPQSLNTLHITNSSGQQVPLSAISTISQSVAPLAVNHQGLFAASTISFNLAGGVSLSQATQAIEESFARLGTTVQGGFQGTAKVFQASLESQPWLILAALLSVYIVLGMLYESFIHPLTILSTLPSAGVGALLALMISGNEFNLMAMIGVVLLIGIVKKNAILMIDFALDLERQQQVSPLEAIRQACLLRLRPILMTTMAALLGALPLTMGQGEGSEMRFPLGISIVGGLILSQLLTLYTTPVVYLYLDRLRWYVRGRRQPTTYNS
ncbi:efflux RND transporter permease subunit [Candidatus Magnetaquicoccus inordinatus]|uniref:efflux RND transporter permease subunit n=1 Tax=Candidatus Magnetaquicoccus inordinatus TaxID=2496818 RepID=UPI00102C673A|nr:efflux RND transporter permease subunit [Candidatus Magnetaquicoccus inordinatus]